MHTVRPVWLAGFIVTLAACSEGSSDGKTERGASNDGSARGGREATGTASAVTRGGTGITYRTAGGVGAGTDQPAAGGSASGLGTGSVNANLGGRAVNPSGGSNAASGRPATSSGGQLGTGPNGSGGNPQGGSPDECAAVTSNAQTVPPVIEFVIDLTGSLRYDAYPSDANNATTKWTEMQRVLPRSFAGLPDAWAVGISYYNFSMVDPASGCFAGQQTVPIAPLSLTQRNAIGDSIWNQIPQELTPTLAAWRYGLSQLVDWTPLAGYEASPRYLVVITDGVPTVNNDGCTAVSPVGPIDQNEYDGLVRIVQDEGKAAGVRTFVVGVLGSEEPQNAPYDPRYMLSQLAVAGGTPQPAGCVPRSGTVVACPPNAMGDATCVVDPGSYCHFDMTTNPDFAAGLTQALESIATQVISCSFPVPTPTDGRFVDSARVLVSYVSGEGNELPLTRAADTACTDGDWFFSAANGLGEPTRLDLCPALCATVTRDLGASLQVTFTCLEVM